MVSRLDKYKVIETSDGSLSAHSSQYDEDFHSSMGARTEAEELYMGVSGFRDRVNKAGGDTLAVLDVGLGLGYNALTTISHWWDAAAPFNLHILSLEQEAELVEMLIDQQAPWLPSPAAAWQEVLQAFRPGTKGGYTAIVSHPRHGEVRLQWNIVVGDARQQDLSVFGEDFDYIWQDAFSPQKNPELWSVEWFEKLAQVSHPETCLVTYSVARLVRDHLEAAGWSYTKINAPGRKKHWLRAKPVSEAIAMSSKPTET